MNINSTEAFLKGKGMAHEYENKYFREETSPTDNENKQSESSGGNVQSRNSQVKVNPLRHNGGTICDSLTNYYLVLMFTVFPLFFTDAYFNIRHDKYMFFSFLSIAFVIMESVFSLSVIRKQGVSDKTQYKSESNEKWYKKLSFTDCAVIAFFGSCVISTLLSEHIVESLTGTAGRNNGLILMTVYTAVYFVITRFYRYRKYVFIAFSIVSCIVFLLAVLNCFYIDVLGMFEQISDTETINNFTSTIGNKNLMSSYICIALPVMIALSVVLKSNLMRILYLVSSGLGFASLITSDSDSGVLGVGVFLVICFIIYVRKISRLKRFFLTLTVMLLFAKLLRLFSLVMNDNSKEMDGFLAFLVYDGKSFFIIAVFACATALLYVLDLRKKNIILPKTVQIVFASLALAALVCAFGVVVYFSAFDTQSDLGKFETLLRFNDKWGTHRGFMWIRSMWIFNDASFIQKLFGTGCDTFYYAFEPYFGDLLKFGDSSTNAAHNEYVNYLITNGVFGLTAYLSIIGGAVVRAFKSSKSNPLAIVCVSPVICYAVQAVVNIAQPITTPLFVIFIALCEASARKSDGRRIKEPSINKRNSLIDSAVYEPISVDADTGFLSGNSKNK